MAFSDHLGYASKKGGLAAGFGKTNVKKSTTKGGLAAASAAMNMNSLANSLSKVVKSLPKGKVSNPSGESDDWTAASHPPCVYSYETCAGPVPLSSQGGPFSASPWTSEQWAAAGWIVGGALLVGLGIACIAATAGICGATILASAGAVAVTSAGTTAPPAPSRFPQERSSAALQSSAGQPRWATAPKRCSTKRRAAMALTQVDRGLRRRTSSINKSIEVKLPPASDESTQVR